jgi:hypothetical protein
MDLYIRKEIKMSSTKLLASILLVLAVMFAQVGNVAAAPQTQDGTTTTITGTIQTITVDPDTNTVIVTVLLEDQVTTQTVSLDPLNPAYSDLFNPDTHELIALVGDSVAWEVNSADVVPDEEPVEPDVHPISWLLAQFFFNGDPDIAIAIDSFHNGDFKIIGDDGTEQTLDQVFGFGVIAQSLWMSRNLTEDGTADADLAGLILQAKQTGDYSEFTLPDGTSLWGDGDAPTNWGQFKKALLDKKHNLGVIVSGQADPDSSTDPLLTQQHGNGKDKENKGKGKDKNKNHP